MTLARLFVLALLIIGVPAQALAFPPPGLDQDAQAYRDRLVAERPPQPAPNRVAEARDALARAIADGQTADVIARLEQLIGLSPDADEGPLWRALGEAWTRATPPDPSRALQAFWLASQRTGSIDERHDILSRMADLFEGPLSQPNLALDTLETIRSENADRAGLSQRIAALRRIVGLEVRNVRVDVDRDAPQVCFELSNVVRDAPGRRFEDFVSVTPAVDELVAEPSDESLCLTGFEHGTSYSVTLREGLPADGGVILRRNDVFTVDVGDRSPRVSFRGDAFILPRQGPQGVPVTTVNLDAIDVSLYRINDRNVVPQLVQSRLFRSLNPGSARRVAESRGEQVWQGTMDVERRRNEPVVTAIPINELLDRSEDEVVAPGLYVLTARAAGVPDFTQPWALATQWLMISDLGLTVVSGANGMEVFVRSLATAQPLANVSATLTARNNAELAQGTSDSSGRITFDHAAAGGEGGRAPAAVLAYGEDGDFAVIDLSRAAFDLTDRGVGGRAVPGPMDAFVYADRGVFRPGETANISVLLRDDRGDAIEGFPLTLRVLRPNGTVFQEGAFEAAAPGMYVLPLQLTRTAPLGTWSVLALADPESEPVGRLDVQVEEFVPERLEVTLEGSKPAIIPGEPFTLTATSRFLFGPPAAGLPGTARVLISRNEDPYPAWKDFHFGLVQDSMSARTQSLQFAPTDADGVTQIPVTLPPLPDTTVALQATFDVGVQEPGGRPTRQSLTVPVRHQPFAVGIRRLFDGGRVDEDSEIGVEIVAVDADGNAVERSDLSIELLEERWVYQWYIQNGQYNFRTSIRSRSLQRNTLTTSADGAVERTFDPLPYGRYRLEVGDSETGVASSVRFSVGWQVSAVASDTPDTLDLSTDRASYRPGETARVMISPPFGGEALVTVANDRVVATQTVAVPEEGVTVDLPVTEDWGVGAYVTATVYRPPQAGRDYLPVRAIGLTWVAMDPAEKTLEVQLPEVDTIRPRQRVELPVRVTGVDGATVTGAYVTLAAVDEGVLQLTRFASPDPAAHYLGKRRLGVEIRDDYGRLISALSEPIGAIRQGGDQSLGSALPDVPINVVSLFSGPVAVDADGTARISLDIPDFNGELRLMAVAFDSRRTGSASRSLTVRDPLVADLILPRFLAPGDESQATVSLFNVEAAAGAYRVSVTGDGAVAADEQVAEVALEQGQRSSLVVPITGVRDGRGTVRLAVSGPNGFAVERDLSLTVRTARPRIALTDTRQLEPGSVARFGADWIAPYLEGTAEIRLTFGTRPPIDVAGLLTALDRYPHGCIEQVVSRALPLLYTADVARALGMDDERDVTTRSRVGTAIGLVLDKQRYDGAFGMWSGFDAEEPWLTAYALEFLTRARDAGHTVPEAPYAEGLKWLRDYAVDGGRREEDLVSRAYALYVLSLSGVRDPGALRYFSDAYANQLPTPLARGQLAAALIRYGNDRLAEELINDAVGRLNRQFWYADFGSTTRDAAALIRILADADRLEGRLPTLMDRLPTGRFVVDDTNTQEKAWIVVAAAALLKDDAQPALDVTGTQPLAVEPSGPLYLAPSVAEIGQGVQVANVGEGAVWQAVAVSGVPAEPQPAAREGLSVRRWFHDRSGEDLNLDTLKVGDTFVMIIGGEATTGVSHQALLTHPLPAGWEIENARLTAAELESMPWIGAVTLPKAVEARDDRYVAAIDLTPNASTFRVAFLVRIVTPGTYELPGATLEDMYRPRVFARQRAGRITIAGSE